MPDDNDQQDRARHIRQDRAEQRELREQVAAAVPISDGEAAVLRRAETQTRAQGASLRRQQVTQFWHSHPRPR